MLKDKTEHIEELYDLCNNEEQRSLVKNLLVDFSEMNDEVFNLCLLDMRECAKQNIEASSLTEREKHVAKESVDKAVHEIAKRFKEGMIQSGRLIETK